MPSHLHASMLSSRPCTQGSVCSNRETLCTEPSLSPALLDTRLLRLLTTCGCQPPTGRARWSHAVAQANVCSYLETICAEPGLAQALLDTRLPQQLGALLSSARSGLVRAHAAACLGLLIRHATFIAPSHAGKRCSSCSRPPRRA